MNTPPLSLIETLLDNANYMPSHDNDAKNKEPSACEIKCQVQQAALVKCMASIQLQNEHTDDASKEDQRVDNSCLAPAVAAWTDCCTKANDDTS